MIERGILPEGTELTPINPMTPGTFSEGDSHAAVGHAERRREAAVQPDGRGLRRLLASTPTTRWAGSSTTSRSRASSTTRSSSTAPTTAPRARAARTARSTRTSSSTPGPTRSRTTCRCSTSSAGRTTYNHYPTGWAVAFSTPYRMFKRYSYQGGVCDPLVIHWPAGHRRPAARSATQYHHCTDIVPTILDCCGVEMPDVVDGYEQTPLPGVSMRYSFDDGRRADDEGDAVLRDARHARHLAQGLEGGRRARAGADRAAGSSTRTAGSSSTPTRTARRRTTSPSEHPEKVEELEGAVARGGEEVRRAAAERPRRSSSSGRSSTPSPIPDERAVHLLPGHDRGPGGLRGPAPRAPPSRSSPRSSSPRTSEGVIVAQGSRFGGYSLFVKDGKLTTSTTSSASRRSSGSSPTRRRSGTHIVGVEFTKERMGEHHEWHGPLKLHVDDEVVAEDEIRTIASALLAVRRGPVHRLRRRRRGEQRVRAGVRVHGRQDRQGRLRRRRRRSTSTSSGELARGDGA